MERNLELEFFFADVEKCAFRIAEVSTGNRDDALGILQDAMCKLVDKYAARNPEEWGPLFHTILHRMIVDWYRRNAVREKFRGWFGVIMMMNTKTQLRMRRMNIAKRQNRKCTRADVLLCLIV